MDADYEFGITSQNDYCHMNFACAGGGASMIIVALIPICCTSYNAKCKRYVVKDRDDKSMRKTSNYFQIWLYVSVLIRYLGRVPCCPYCDSKYAFSCM